MGPQRGGSAAHRAKQRRRVAHRQTARGKWAPHVGTAPTAVEVDAIGVFDRFEDASLAAFWSVAGGGSVSSGSGLEMDPPPGGLCRVVSRPVTSMVGKSMTWSLDFDAALFSDLTSYVEIALLDATTEARVVGVWLEYDGGASAWKMHIEAGALTDEFVTTDASEWAHVRVDSDPADPATVTIWRSADRRSWVDVGSNTFGSSADIAAVKVASIASRS